MHFQSSLDTHFALSVVLLVIKALVLTAIALTTS